MFRSNSIISYLKGGCLPKLRGPFQVSSNLVEMGLQLGVSFKHARR
jgi:hypothetical protein